MTMAIVLLVLVVVAVTLVALALILRPGLVEALAGGRRRADRGPSGLVGEVGVVRRALDPLGQVAVGGELWRARRSWVDEQEPALGVGEPVVVERVNGLTLVVRRAEAWEIES